MEAQAFEQSTRSGGAAEGSWNPMVSAQAFEQSARAGGAAGGSWNPMVGCSRRKQQAAPACLTRGTPQPSRSACSSQQGRSHLTEQPACLHRVAEAGAGLLQSSSSPAAPRASLRHCAPPASHCQVMAAARCCLPPASVVPCCPPFTATALLCTAVHLMLPAVRPTMPHAPHHHWPALSLQHIDWGFVIKSQHYGTAVFTIAYLIILACVHWLADSRSTPIFLYDASIAYPYKSDTIPAVAAVLVPFALLILSMLAYEFFVYRKVGLPGLLQAACGTACVWHVKASSSGVEEDGEASVLDLLLQRYMHLHRHPLCWTVLVQGVTPVAHGTFTEYG